jgi:hypothetical protein
MASAIVVPSSLVEQACAVAAQQGWYKVEASYSLPCGSRASIVGWRPNSPAEHAHARAPQSVAPPQEAQEQVANEHVTSTTTSEKVATPKVPSKAQKKRERAKRKANNTHAAVSDSPYKDAPGCAAPELARLPAPGTEDRPVSPLAGVEHVPKRQRPPDLCVCRLPSCDRPCYRDPATGSVHEFCGRSHAAAFAALPADARNEKAAEACTSADEESEDEAIEGGGARTNFMG